MSRKSRIEKALAAKFAPERLEILDESHMHAGHHHSGSDHHAGFDGSGETHIRIRIVAPAFAAMSRIERHRAVNAVLQPEIDSGLHALAIEAAAPGEKTRW